MKEKVINEICYGGISKEEYLSIKKHIDRKNFNSLQVTSFIGWILLGLLFFCSYYVPSVSKNRLLYGSFFGFMLLLYIVSEVYVKKHKNQCIWFNYIFLGGAFAFSIILGVPLLQDSVATTFCVLLFALPLLVIDKPYRISMLLVVVSVIFGYASLHVKPRAVASVDLVNVVSFLFLGVIVNFFVMRTKFSEIINRIYIEKERDTDDLTKLMTKASAMRQIEAYMHNGGKEAALLVIDIDNFKMINDTMGHAYGDAVLRIMGECIITTFRSTDILARFGGDEFVLFLAGTSNTEIVKGRVESLIEEMNHRLTMKEHAIKVTGSIGVAFYPEHADNYNALFKKADEALYQSKGQGKNCYTFYFDSELE